METLNAYHYESSSAVRPERLVILLHGLGADGRDLLALAPYFAESLPGTVFVSPDAPFPCDMAPMGHQWFSLQEWTPESILRGVQDAAPLLQQFIDEQLEKYGLAEDSLALVGFSQGTMMSLYAGLRRTKPLAGILAYSGALVWEDDLDSGDLQRTPIHLIHGDADDVVPVSAYHHAREKLDAAGFDVSGGVQPGLQHGIDERAMESGRDFLARVLM